MPLSSHHRFDAALAHAAESVERTMDRLLPKGDTGEARVFEAMRYSSLGGGKRLFDGFEKSIDLEPIQTVPSPFATHITYRIRR